MRAGIVLAGLCLLTACGTDADDAPVFDSVHAFYQGWYANEEMDGFTAHWNHDVDGWYTYFGSDGSTYGSTSGRWPVLADAARRHGKLLIPCVGPGYIDTRIRPWNVSTARARDDGACYDRMFEATLSLAAEAPPASPFRDVNHPRVWPTTWIVTLSLAWGRPSGLPDTTTIVSPLRASPCSSVYRSTSAAKSERCSGGRG